MSLYFAQKTPEQKMIYNLVMFGQDCAETALKYKETIDKRMFAETDILDVLDLPRSDTLADYAEDCLEASGKHTFRCACGKPVGVHHYSADGASEIETRCSCGRHSDEYIGYHDRHQPMPLEERAAEHNASMEKS